MIPVKLQTVLDFARAVLVLLLVFAPLLARAQVGPDMRDPLAIHLFGTFTDGFSSGGRQNNYGYSLGGFVQTRHFWGLESRGTYLRWGSAESWFDALAGPRVAIHFARFSLYGAALGGVGHPIARTHGPKSRLESGNGVAWKVLGGLDYYAGRHFSVRLGEISFAENYALPRDVRAVDFSGGVVYHIPVRER
jgi:hypothetical protein